MDRIYAALLRRPAPGPWAYWNAMATAFVVLIIGAAVAL